MPSVLPIEVIQHIITFLRPEPHVSSPGANSGLESRSALCACTLLCRGLFPFSRRIMFETILLRSRRPLNSLASLAQHTSSLDLWLKVVRELRIYGDALDVTPHLLARRLPNLQVISISNLDWTFKSPHMSFFPCLSQFRSVTTLRLFTGQFRTYHQLTSLISSLPSLSELGLWDIMWLIPDKGLQPKYPSRTTKLSTLELLLPVGSRVTIYNWLCHMPHIQCVRKLGVKHLDTKADETEALNSLLRALGSSLEILAIDLTYSTGE